ncbi:MAG: hypothetical protein MI865_00925, partial [Proteobacteria bacterium]|nr:hypothetical protein [Pseudomonadota bacterium]
ENASGGTILSTGSNGPHILNAVLNNQGLIDLDQVLTISNVSNSSHNSGTIDLGANLTLAGGGGLDWSGGTIQNTNSVLGGTFSIIGTGTRVLNGPSVSVTNANFSGGSLDVQSGSFTTTGATTISAPTSLSNSGTLLRISTPTIDPGTSLTISSGTIDAAGTTTVDGSLIVNGTYNTPSDVIVVNGSLSVPASGTVIASVFNFNTGAILNGAGTMTGDVNVGNGATLAPGTSPGTLTITGDLNLFPSSTTILEIDSATLFDIINVTNNVFLDGDLNIVAVAGTSGSFPSITCGAGASCIFGQFASVDLASATVNYNSMDVTIDIAGSSTTVDGTNNVIVLNEFQDELGDTEYNGGGSGSVYPLREGEDDEEKKDLACR